MAQMVVSTIVYGKNAHYSLKDPQAILQCAGNTVFRASRCRCNMLQNYRFSMVQIEHQGQHVKFFSTNDCTGSTIGAYTLSGCYDLTNKTINSMHKVSAWMLKQSMHGIHDACVKLFSCVEYNPMEELMMLRSYHQFVSKSSVLSTSSVQANYSFLDAGIIVVCQHNPKENNEIRGSDSNNDDNDVSIVSPLGHGLANGTTSQRPHPYYVTLTEPRLCGGVFLSIIPETWILTAAHCVYHHYHSRRNNNSQDDDDDVDDGDVDDDDKETIIQKPSGKIRYGQSTSNSAYAPFHRVIIHPMYNPDNETSPFGYGDNNDREEDDGHITMTTIYDLALIQLDNPIPIENVDGDDGDVFVDQQQQQQLRTVQAIPIYMSSASLFSSSALPSSYVISSTSSSLRSSLSVLSTLKSASMSTFALSSSFASFPSSPSATIKSSPSTTIKSSPSATIKSSPSATIKSSASATIKLSPSAMVTPSSSTAASASLSSSFTNTSTFMECMGMGATQFEPDSESSELMTAVCSLTQDHRLTGIFTPYLPAVSITQFESSSLSKSLCHGDSGGPLVVSQPQQDYLDGVLSRIMYAYDPTPDQPTCPLAETTLSMINVYVKPSFHLDWISHASGLDIHTLTTPSKPFAVVLPSISYANHVLPCFSLTFLCCCLVWILLYS
ncbi:uncharacterized protein BX664DRAFT_314316 [Halteromyces radiatus]|uniref:uncharacterized protein n=1 Tax=Halteromyces radiatus TaxID=101107 RepID=UPI0022200AFA|nr:uncharacterized protein BX664DRAFT_314316 [Halteromyces radiatus]KAI8089076.1 hypothetical protein BX664DRAFT_314316 [Halteromyces radiatus]